MLTQAKIEKYCLVDRDEALELEEQIETIIALKNVHWLDYKWRRQDDDDWICMAQCSDPELIRSLFGFEVHLSQYCFERLRIDLVPSRIADYLMDELDETVRKLERVIKTKDWTDNPFDMVRLLTDVVVSIGLLLNVRKYMIVRVACSGSDAFTAVSNMIRVNEHLSTYRSILTSAVVNTTEVNPFILETNYLVELIDHFDGK